MDEARVGSSPYHQYAVIVGEPEIGPGTWIGPFTVIDGSGGLRIGSGCDVSTGAQIYTHSTVNRCVSGRSYDRVDRAPTTIGDRVFIGANAVILMGLTIGEAAVIGAGAVVTKDVPSYTVVVGAPAHAISRVAIENGEVRRETLR
jgi:acetyltransferase-like isoleucine patch superfamily enzyme